MASQRPDGYVDLTEMAHPVRRAAAAGLNGAADAPTAPSDEQEMERVEEVRSHASSHHTAGTVAHDPR